MRTVDERLIRAPAAVCYRIAADVERWPEILPHYRYVRFHDAEAFARGTVEMAAWRDFLGPVRYPTWWVSTMEGDPAGPLIRYRHIRGITSGMDVRWQFRAHGENATHVQIVHAWDGPPWPLIGGLAARHVIGPHFISAIATRTLAGVAVQAERVSTQRVSLPEPTTKTRSDTTNA